jgi:hypothetical protein
MCLGGGMEEAGILRRWKALEDICLWDGANAYCAKTDARFLFARLPTHGI